MSIVLTGVAAVLGFPVLVVSLRILLRRQNSKLERVFVQLGLAAIGVLTLLGFSLGRM